MNNFCVLDAETKSLLNLKKCGAHRYASDPSTEVLCISYAINNNPVKLWVPPQPIPTDLIKARRANYTFIAHSVGFERSIWHYKLAPVYGWPEEPAIEQWIDTIALAYACALPGGLDKVCAALNLKYKKDTVGTRTMLQVTKPRKARKGEDPTKTYWYSDDERMQRLYQYCMADTEAEREVYRVLEPLSKKETQVWYLDQRINDRGFYIDVQLVKAARAVAHQGFTQLNAEMSKITNGAVCSVNEVAKLKKWLTVHQDLIADGLNKADIQKFLAGKLRPTARHALELRQLGAQAAVKKVDAFLNHLNGDNRIRGAFQYHAAGPGRWAGRGTQIQNLKRTDNKINMDKAIRIIGTGSYTKANKVYDAPLAVIGSIIRSMICARPGHVLIGADFSQIEARVTAWLANEYSKLEMFKKFDAGTGPDPYIAAVMKIFHLPADQVEDKRQIGKTAELAFGFGGGLGAFRRFTPGPRGVEAGNPEGAHGRGRKSGGAGDSNRQFEIAEIMNKFSDAKVQEIKNAWRAAHPRIVKMWHGLYDAFDTAIKHRNEAEVTYDKIKFFCDDNFGWMTLPSGRRNAYPQIGYGYILKFADGKVVREEDAENYSHNQFELDINYERRRCITWKDNSHGWQNVKGWSGTITENAVQGIARDLLAEAMLRVDAAGLPIVAHVHDECIIEVPEKSADKIIKQFAELMMVVPPWAEGLPIMAETWMDKRYIK